MKGPSQRGLHAALAHLLLSCVRHGGVGCLWEQVGPVFERFLFLKEVIY